MEKLNTGGISRRTKAETARTDNFEKMAGSWMVERLLSCLLFIGNDVISAHHFRDTRPYISKKEL